MPKDPKSLRSSAKTGLLSRLMLSIFCGIGFTMAMLVGFAQFQKPKLVQPDAGLDDLKESAATFTLPPPPPPPPEERPAVDLPPNFVQFDVSPSDSPIKIAASPPNLEVMSMESMTAARINTAAVARFDFAPGAFKPNLDAYMADVRHVWDRSEVDEPPLVIFRKAPEVSADMLKSIPNPKVMLLFVVNVDGSVENIRMLRSAEPTFDALIMEALQEWKFRPAVKKGKTVRCWVIQPVSVTPPRKSRFSAN